MDDIDRSIIGVLSEDGRASLTDVASEVGLSLSAASARLKRLRTSGVISGFQVVLGAGAIGREIDALVDLQLEPGAPFADIDESLLESPEVVDAMHVTGRFDYQARVRCRSIDELDQFLRRCKEEFGVRETSTRVVLHTVDGLPRQPAP